MSKQGGDTSQDEIQAAHEPRKRKKKRKQWAIYKRYKPEVTEYIKKNNPENSYRCRLLKYEMNWYVHGRYATERDANTAIKAAERIAPWKFYDRIYGTHFPFEFKLVHED